MLWQYCKTLSCLAMAFYFFGCAGKNNTLATTSSPHKDSVNQIAALPNNTEEAVEENSADSLLVSRNKQIAGTWNALDGEEELTMRIVQDTLFYIEHSESHRYELKKDSIYIHYPDYILSGKPLLLKDTFAIISEDHISKFSRVKN